MPTEADRLRVDAAPYRRPKTEAVCYNVLKALSQGGQNVPHYLIQFRYSAAAMKAMVDKPQDREAAARAAIEAYGGKMHCFYFAYGKHDGLTVSEFPDNEHAMAALMALNAAAGVAGTTTTPLVTSAEATAAMHLAHDTRSTYRPPQG